MRLRKAHIGDLDSVLALYAQAVGSTYCTWNQYYPGRMEAEADIVANALYLWEEDGILAGAVSVVSENELDGYPCWQVSGVGVCEIARVVIGSRYRGRGYAAVLVRTVLRLLRDEGCRAVHLSAAVKNLPACRTYQRLGFAICGEETLYGGTYYLMEKCLLPEDVVLLPDPQMASSLFDGCQETMVWSCLEGSMGKVYAHCGPEVVSAVAILGDFCFFAGEPSKALASLAVNDGDFHILVPRDAPWEKLLREEWQGALREGTRFSIAKESNVWNRSCLQQAVDALPVGYSLVRLDEAWYDTCLKNRWSCDFVSQFRDGGDYACRGMGVLALHNGTPVAGASSYAVYSGGIEIEIHTQDSFRRQGLALACGARLILDCLERGLYPSWDAANLASIALAEKLGYHLDHPYTVFFCGL